MWPDAPRRLKYSHRRSPRERSGNSVSALPLFAFPFVGVNDCLTQLVGLYEVSIKVTNILGTQVKLTFAGVSSVLAFRVVGTILDLVRRLHPVFDCVAPDCDPDEYITAGRFDLLEIHPELLF